MSRRVTLPGADELFRSTGPAGGPAAAPATAPERAAEPEPGQAAAQAGSGQAGSGQAGSGQVAALPAPVAAAPEPVPLAAVADEEYDEPAPVRRRPRPMGDRRPTGRERHDEKITVYCSAEELIDIERARLTLRGEYGLAADRGRIVREALAVVLADLEAKGDQSILVRRLRGR
jgi:hypothetical protein